MDRKDLFLGTFFLVIVLSMLFVLAATSAPTNFVFSENSTDTFDTGAFAMNWSAGGGETEINYTIYIYADDVLYTSGTNNSETGYSYTNTTDANYTFTVAGVNSTGIGGANSTNISMIVDATGPVITFPFYSNVTLWGSSLQFVLQVIVDDTSSGVTNSVCLIDINGTNQTIDVSGGWCNSTAINLTGASEGNQTINLWANDTLGNLNLNNSYAVQIDASSPLTTIGAAPVAYYNSSSADIVFENSLCTENREVSSVMLLGNWSGGWHENHTNSSYINNTQVNITVEGIPEGGYVWSFYCNDTAGNLAVSSNYTLTVDTTAPGITFTCSPSAVSADDTVTCTCSGSDSGSGFNSSTLSFVSSPSTSDTGDYTITCTGSDYAGNSGSDTASYSVEQVGGGGSSSSSSDSTDDDTTEEDITSETPSQQHNQSIEKITPGNVTIIKDFDAELGLKQIQIYVTNEVQNVEIVVSKFDHRPANVSVKKEGKVHKYLQIEIENLNESLENATITIQVEKTWINESELTKEEIALFKFNEDSQEWDELETTYIEEDNIYYYYDAEITSFSYFAIVEKSKTSLLLLWIIVGAVILLLILGVLIVVLKNKKK